MSLSLISGVGDSRVHVKGHCEGVGQSLGILAYPKDHGEWLNCKAASKTNNHFFFLHRHELIAEGGIAVLRKDGGPELFCGLIKLQCRE